MVIKAIPIMGTNQELYLSLYRLGLLHIFLPFSLPYCNAVFLSTERLSRTQEISLVSETVKNSMLTYNANGLSEGSGTIRSVMVLSWVLRMQLMESHNGANKALQ